jgi:hypothetical protein
MEYPGHVVKEGERDRQLVRSIQERLDASGCGPLGKTGTFGPKTRTAVQLFQARHVDAAGAPLRQDGKVGPLTWAALFGDGALPAAPEAPSPFLGAVLATAGSQVGVMEQPRDSNSGPEVDGYLRRAGVSLDLPTKRKPWCCAFVYWCFDETARSQVRTNPMMRTAGCLTHWDGAEALGAERIAGWRAAHDPGLLTPGMVFIMDYGEGKGHTGFVEGIESGLLHTIEGNTDGSRTREGGGVYRLTRKITDINKGFIDYRNA